MTLRDEIAKIIQVTDVPWVTADEIIDLFRDALLSDKAIKAGNNMLPSYDQDTDASDVIMAALDTITQE